MKCGNALVPNYASR